MGLFWCGALIGGVAMFLSMVVLCAVTVEEKDKQIKYLREKLAEQAEQARTTQ